MSKESNRKDNPAGPIVERRMRDRPDGSAGDWESIALRRVARRVQSLTVDGLAPQPDESPEYGWEDAALRNLSRRLKDDPG